MGELIGSIFSALGVFVGYPWLAAVIGLALVVQGRRARRSGVVAVGVMWGVYAAYETGMQQRWLCTGECNIRVDLVLIFPILLISSAIAARTLYLAGQTRRRQTGTR
jgi:hypothetical protein